MPFIRIARHHSFTSALRCHSIAKLIAQQRALHKKTTIWYYYKHYMQVSVAVLIDNFISATAEMEQVRVRPARERQDDDAARSSPVDLIREGWKEVGISILVHPSTGGGRGGGVRLREDCPPTSLSPSSSHSCPRVASPPTPTSPSPLADLFQRRFGAGGGTEGG